MYFHAIIILPPSLHILNSLFLSTRSLKFPYASTLTALLLVLPLLAPCLPSFKTPSPGFAKSFSMSLPLPLYPLCPSSLSLLRSSLLLPPFPRDPLVSHPQLLSRISSLASRREDKANGLLTGGISMGDEDIYAVGVTRFLAWKKPLLKISGSDCDSVSNDADVAKQALARAVLLHLASCATSKQRSAPLLRLAGLVPFPCKGRSYARGK